MKKFLTLALAASALIVPLTACGGGTKADQGSAVSKQSTGASGQDTAQYPQQDMDCIKAWNKYATPQRMSIAAMGRELGSQISPKGVSVGRVPDHSNYCVVTYTEFTGRTAGQVVGPLDGSSFWEANSNIPMTELPDSVMRGLSSATPVVFLEDGQLALGYN
jgi:hypothetical protein